MANPNAHKFKVFRLSDINLIEKTLNEFTLGPIYDYTISMPDYRIIVLVILYSIEDEPEKAKSDKAAK